MSKDLLNWKQVSIKLSGSDNAIRKKSIPKKHQNNVDKLLNLIKIWEKEIIKNK